MVHREDFGKLDSRKRHILHSLYRTQLIYTCILLSFSLSLIIHSDSLPYKPLSPLLSVSKGSQNNIMKIQLLRILIKGMIIIMEGSETN